jgi:hypothetical protein
MFEVPHGGLRVTHLDSDGSDQVEEFFTKPYEAKDVIQAGAEENLASRSTRTMACSVRGEETL